LGFPNQKNVEPRYQQITLDPEERNNKLQQIFHQMQRWEFDSSRRLVSFKI
jgi:hypothetical protein